MRRALGSSKIVVMDSPGADTFVVSAKVKLTPIDDRSGQLDLTWLLKDPSGKEIGKIDQSNPVPLAATRGSWAGFGDIVAQAAVEGILELLEQATQEAAVADAPRTGESACQRGAGAAIVLGQRLDSCNRKPQ